MTAGLEIFNDSNTIVLESNYSNFMLSAKGSVQTTPFNTGAGGIQYLATVTTDTKNPQIFFSNTNGSFIAIPRISLSGTTTTFHINSSTQQVNLSYYIFSTDIPPVGGNFGLQVFKEDRSLAFDSSSKFLRYETVVQTWWGPGINQTTYQLPPSLNTRAVCLTYTRLSYFLISTYPFPRIGAFVDSFRVNQNSIDTQRMQLYVFPGQLDQGFTPVSATPAQLIVADVTGY